MPGHGGELPGPLGTRLAWRVTTADEDRRAAAHALLLDLLATAGSHESHGAHGSRESLRIVRQCPACGSDAHGVPLARATGTVRAAGATGTARTTHAARLPLVSISYADGLVAVGVAPPSATAFGIDLELDSPETRTRVAEALGDETADVATWTRIEAAAKARGTGLRGTNLRGTNLSETDPHGATRPNAELAFAELRLDLTPGGHAAILTVALATSLAG